MRDDIINEEICFNSVGSHVCVMANKDCKMTVCAGWERSNYGEANDRYSSKEIPIREVYSFLKDKDKLISEEAKKLSGVKIDELTKLISAFEKNLREKDRIICEQNNKIEAFKTTLKEMRKK